MVYKLIGMAVVKGARVFLRRRYGPSNNPKPAIALGVVAAAVALAVVASKKDESR